MGRTRREFWERRKYKQNKEGRYWLIEILPFSGSGHDNVTLESGPVKSTGAKFAQSGIRLGATLSEAGRDVLRFPACAIKLMARQSCFPAILAITGIRLNRKE
jgi:hypothetical protein